jgi:hypothetical protein
VYRPLVATCDFTSCENNVRRVRTLVCSSCGHCATDALHSACDVVHLLKDPVVAICGNADCLNNANVLEVVVCSACGECANCSFHDH